MTLTIHTDVGAPRRPTARFMLEHPAHGLAMGFGSGLSPWAPGTAGTLWAWLSFVLLAPWMSDTGWACLLLASTAVGWWACTLTAQHLAGALAGDPGGVGRSGCGLWALSFL